MNEHLLKIDWDTHQHLSSIGNHAGRDIDFAKDAAIISLHGLAKMEDRPAINTPKQFIWFLLAKCVQNLRFGCHGVELGYYSGTYSVFRSAYESLAFAVLFAEDEKEVKIWVENELSRNKSRFARRKRQTDRAKKALHSQETQILKDASMDFWRVANQRIHATVRGIAQEFNLQSEMLIPDSSEEALVQSSEDFQRALDIFIESESFESGRIRSPSSSPENEWIQFGTHYDEATTGSLAGFAFYIGHRLLDNVDEIFQITDAEYQRMYSKWHRELRRKE